LAGVALAKPTDSMRLRRFLTNKTNYHWVVTVYFVVALNLFFLWPLWDSFPLREMWFLIFMEIVFVFGSMAMAAMMWSFVMLPMLEKTQRKQGSEE
jgi:Na+/melibiose symporter-like transporter